MYENYPMVQSMREIIEASKLEMKALNNAKFGGFFLKAQHPKLMEVYQPQRKILVNYDNFSLKSFLRWFKKSTTVATQIENYTTATSIRANEK